MEKYTLPAIAAPVQHDARQQVDVGLLILVAGVTSAGISVGSIQTSLPEDIAATPSRAMPVFYI